VDNIKWGVLAGIAAFIISLLTGLIAGVHGIHVFLRALLFLAVFFGLGMGIRVVISVFLPELLFSDSEPSPQYEENNNDDDEFSGRRVDINVGDNEEYAVPDSSIPNSEHMLGNIEDLVSGIFKPEPGAIDRSGKDEYNDQGSGFSAGDLDFSNVSLKSSSPSGSPGGDSNDKPAFTPSFAESGLSGLPDLDSMAAVFSGGSTFTPSKAPTEEYATAESVRKPLNPNKTQQLDGDFTPKELAKGISTVLNKEK